MNEFEYEWQTANKTKQLLSLMDTEGEMENEGEMRVLGGSEETAGLSDYK